MSRLTILLTFGVFLLSACSSAHKPEPVQSTEDEPELAAYMGELQRYTHKLGLSLRARNERLAGFYFHETESVLEQISTIEEYEGIPIARPNKAIMDPLMNALERALEAGNFRRGEQAYNALIAGCNACHNATEHGYIRIAPRLDLNPYLQEFSAVD